MSDGPHTGTCRCGRVTLTVTGAPLITSACHCRGCQRMTASAYSLSTLVLSDNLAVAGKVVIGGLHGPDQRHHHCSHCLSWLFTRITGTEEIVNLRTAMFDGWGGRPPFLETATDEKLPWITLPAQRSYPGLPPAEDFPTLMSDYAAWAA